MPIARHPPSSGNRHARLSVADCQTVTERSTMSRRYLSPSEAAGALRRGKSVECFLGKCARDGQSGIRWLSISREQESQVIRLYETADLGDSNFVDVYEFGPLNGELEPGEADEQICTPDMDACWDLLEQRFPGSTKRLVNEGVIQDEYADFVATGRGL